MRGPSRGWRGARGYVPLSRPGEPARNNRYCNLFGTHRDPPVTGDQCGTNTGTAAARRPRLGLCRWQADRGAGLPSASPQHVRGADPCPVASSLAQRSRRQASTRGGYRWDEGLAWDQRNRFHDQNANWSQAVGSGKRGSRVQGRNAWPGERPGHDDDSFIRSQSAAAAPPSPSAMSASVPRHRAVR
jgi:hypothetical protein